MANSFSDALHHDARAADTGTCAVLNEAQPLEGDSVVKHLAHEQSPASRWWVAHTRPRQEKLLAQNCDLLGVGCYLPLRISERRYDRRTLRFSVPLFPGYAFLHSNDEGLQNAWRTKRVVQILDVNDQPRLTRELLQIERLLASGCPIDLYPGLHAGQHCEILSGPLRGLEGVIIRRGGRSRFHVAVTFIGQSAVVEVDGAQLAPCD